MTIPFTATVDALADSGETVILQRNLATSGGTAAVDREIPVTPATLTINDPAAPLAVSLGDDQTVEPGAQITLTGTVTGANSPDADLTTAWQLIDSGSLLPILGGGEVIRLGGIITPNMGLTLTFPATSAAVLAAATPPQDSWVLKIRLRITDPMAAAGQEPVTDEVSITIMAAVAENTAPAFPDDTSVSIPTYTVGQMITPLTLPEAMGGNGALTYTLEGALPAGLTFDGVARPPTITGTPTSTTTVPLYRYVVNDADDDMTTGDTARLSLSIMVNQATPSSQTLSLNPTMVTESATATDITATITLNGGTYAVQRLFSFDSQSGTATEGTDYTALENVTLTIPANAGSGTVIFPFTATVDTVADSGETLTINSTLLTVAGTGSDSALAIATATLTINDGGPVVSLAVNAGADQTVAPGDMVTLTATVTGTATPDADLTVTWGVPSEDQLNLAGDVTSDAGRLIGAIGAGTDLTLTFTVTAANLLADSDNVVFPVRATVTDPNAPADQQTVTDELTITIMPAAGPAPVRPVFFQVASSVFNNYDEGGTAVGGPTTFFAEAGTETVVLTLSGADAAFFSITQAGALSFNPAPDYEMPRGMAPSGTNTNFYTVTITATASRGLTQDQTVTVNVVDVEEMDAGLTFGGATIVDQTYTVGTPIPTLTLPSATGADPIFYTLTPTPSGLRFQNMSGVLTLSGTPTTAGVTMYTLRAADTGSGQITLMFTVTVEAATPVDAMPTFSVSFFADQAFAPGGMTFTAVDLTLPAATGGDGALTYSLTPAIAGLTLNPSTRVLSGTPSSIVESTHTYTVTDEDNDIATLSFDVVVTMGTPDTAPTLAVTFIAAQNYLTGTAVNFTFPAATGGNAPYTFTLTRSDGSAVDLPGLTFNAGTNPPTLTGTPTAVRGLRGHFYTVHDSDANTADRVLSGSDRARLSFNIVVRAPTPTRLTLSIDPTMVTESATATTITATVTFVGGTYTRSRIVQVGLQDGTALEGPDFPPLPFTTLTIPANTASGTLMFPFTATADGIAEAGGETAKIFAALRDTANAGYDGSLALVNANLIINDPPIVDTAPAFAADASIDDQSYLTRLAITPLTLPAVATPGNGATTYTLTPAIAGLTLDSTSRVLSGTPTTAATVREYTYTARDSDPNMATGDEDTLTFSITVVADTTPSFGTETIADQIFTVGTPVDLTLPLATGGNNGITYSLTAPPTGLIFTPSTRALSGTPTAAFVATDLTYSAIDGDANTEPSDRADITFSITANEPVVMATGLTVTVRRNPGGVITEALEGSTTPTAVIATPTPAGSVFAADQMVTFTVTPASPAARPDSPDDPYVAYNTIAPSTVAFAVGSAEARRTFSLRPTDDAFDHADFPLTVTVTAQPSGISGMATVTLIDNDIRIITTAATATVVAAATTTYDVTLSEQPPTGVAVTVASQGAGTATVSPATLTFTTGDWNMAQPVTVTGVAAGTTTIRHTAPDASGYGYVTNDVDVTVTAAPVAPVFTNADDFDSPIMTPENRAAVGADGYFAATGTGTVTYALTGADMARFTLSAAGTLTFNDAPDFEMPRGMAFASGTNTNDYALTITATNSVGMTAETITVSVTDVNEAPVVATITPNAFTEYTQGTFDITVTDVDAGQTLTYALSAPNHGATLTGNTFTWTPGEADGGVARTFSFTITDSGTPPMMVTGTFDITAMELANRAPTGATITAAGSATSVTNPDTLGLSAAATDPDTGTTLTYTWSSDATGGSFSPATGTSTTWTPPTVTSATPVVLTVTVSDGDATMPMTTTAMQNVMVNPMSMVDTTLALGAVSPQVYTVGQAVALTLPEATGGTAPYTYTLAAPDGSPLPPPIGVVISPTARTLIGTLMFAAETVTYRWTVTDSSSPVVMRNIDFTITVNAAPVANIAPAFVAGAAIGAATFYQDTDITPLTLPRATGGEGAITYALTPAIPGMFFDTVTGVLSGAPTTEAAATTYTYTAGDTDGSAPGTDESSLTISITVLANTIPEFSIIRGPRYTFTVGTAVNQTLPEATGGDDALVYTITRALPDGLTFNAAARPPTITGTPTTASRSVTYRYNADDSDANTAPSDGSSLSFRITVRGAVPTGITMSITDLDGNALTSLNEGIDPLNIRLQFDTVPALSGFTADQDVTITLSTPVAGQVGYSAAPNADFIDRDVPSTPSRPILLTITDDDVVTADSVVTFTATVSPSGFTATAMLTLRDNENSIVTTPAAVTLATGSTADYTVQLEQEPPANVTVTLASVADAIATVSHSTLVFTAANWNVPASITVTGVRGGSTTISHSATAAGGVSYPSTDVMVTVTPVSVDFPAGTLVLDQTFQVDTAVDLTLPTATGATTYRLSSHADRSLPAGLTFDGATRVLSGTPTAAQAAEGYVYSARNPDSLDNLNFDITVVAATTPPSSQTLSLNPTMVTESATPTNIMATITLNGGTYAVDRVFSIGSLTGTATEGTDYTALSNVVLTIPANAASGTVTFPFTAVDDMTVEGGGEALTIRSTLLIVAGTDPDTSLAVANAVITIRDPVAANTAPSFGDATVANQAYPVDTEIPQLTLPTATGGNNGITYTLTPALPAGLTFTAADRTIIGTPTAVATAATYTYTAADGDSTGGTGDEDSLTFSITVESAAIPATGFIVSVVGDSDNAAVSEAREGTTTPVAVTATPTPAGSVFAADQMVTFMLTPASPASRPDSPDDPYVTYNNIAPRTIALAVGDARARTTFSLRPTEDAFDHADFPLTVTATAQPSGISGTATVTLIDNDITIETTLAATTVIAGATATYDVQLTEQPPADTTVTLASQGTGTATVSPATLTFTTGDWNNAQTVTVTGVAAGTTTIRHTAPAASGYGYVTNDVDVTVTAAPVAPTFTNADDFDSPILTPENRATVRATGFFAATGTGTVTYALTGADMARFTLSADGTLTFNDAPDFEMPRGMAPSTGNTNDYALTITATNSVGMTPATVTVSVTDVNEAPVVATITPSAFTEYTPGTFDITVTDVDAGQTLTYALSTPNHGATLTGNTFTWTPGEDDGMVARTFSFTVTDSGTPPMMATGTFDITAMELANRAPTGATITAAAMLTYPDTITLEAAATDPDTGDMLTYAWNAGTEGGSIIDVVGTTATYEPPTLTADDDARMIVLTVTVSDSATPPLTTTATHTVTVNPPAPMGTAPVFTNLAMFTTAISVAENTVAAGVANFFAAPGTGATSLTLDGADSAIFAITDGGTLTFNTAPDFEMPRGVALSGSNTNDYALIVTATNAFGSVMSGAITVRVTDVNEAPVLPEITSPTNFVEYSQGTFNIPFSDPDTGTTLTVTLTGETLGATIATDGTFTWTPGEDDGGVARTFTVAIADDGSPMMSVTRDFTITAMELDNRAPTGATITGGTAVTPPATITLEATAMDADTGTTLTYTWSSDATGDSFDPDTGTSTTTVWTPPVLTAGDAAVTAVITVTVSDGATPALTDTDTHTVTVNPPVPVGTAPAFTNMAMFGTAIEAAENQTGAGVANFFAAPGTGTVTLTLGGTDMALFTITDEGTLTFSDAPNFEMPRGTPVTSTNTNDYALTVTATNAIGSVMSGAITVRVTDANDAPVLPSFVPPTFTEYTEGTLTFAATDEDRPAQMLTYALTGEARGATITGNVFTWTPGEADGGVVRQFGITVTDDGTPPRMVVSAFNITADELANRDPAGAAITAAASVNNPNSLPVSAEATDPDTGDMLTYAWTSSATGDSFSGGGMGASVTWNPPTVTAATMVTLTVTITDTTDGSVTATHVVMVNPMPDTAPSRVTLSVSPAVVTESADATTITVTATLVGGRYTAERRITLSAGSASTATAGTDYTPAISQTITIPANAASGSVDIAFTATVDTDADSGETVIIQRNLATSGGTAAVDRDTSVTPATLTINDPAAGTLVLDAVSPQIYTVGQTVALTLPEATGGTAPLTYTLTAPDGSALPPPTGLTFNAAARTLIGTPSVVTEEVSYRWTVTDSASPPAMRNIDFTITVNAALVVNTAPAFVAGAAIGDATFYQDTNITPLTLPRATGGEGAITYALTPAIPGMFFDTVTGVLSGAPTTEAAATTYTYTAGDTDGSAPGTDESTLTVSITVLANTIPEFSIIRGPRYTFTVGDTVNQTLPEATGGDSTLVYTITRALPDGLTFNAAATPPTITGTPTTASRSVTYRYNVDDSDANEAGDDGSSISFRITIRGAAATDITMTIRDLDGNEITSLNEGADPTTFRLHFDTVPALSGFTADQDVTITLSTPVAGQVGYTGAASVADFIDRDVASTESRQLQLTITDDDVATADGVVIYTATVSPSGFTASAMITLLDNEISIVTTPSAVTLATAETANYTVQLDQEPPATVTVSVASVADAIATVSRSTLVFTTTNWNTPRSVTVTGMRGGSTTIRHSATAAGGFGYPSTDVMVTVTPVSVNFPAGTLVLDQNFQVGTAVDLTLPTATGATTYRLSSHADQSLPAGLTFDGATRVLSGTPTAAQTAEGYAYSARNPDNLDNLNFNITVVAMAADTAPTGFTLAFNPATVTESATATTITATVTLVGGTFPVERSIRVSEFAGGTATSGTDYTQVENFDLTIPANMASASTTFPFTATDDMTADDGETANIRGRLLTADGNNFDPLSVATASITINDPVVAPTPPSTQTLTINPTSVTESATPTDITATVTLNGGTFAIARQFSLSSLSGGSTGTTATAGTDYTALGGVTPLTIPANMTSGTVTFPFSATVDTIAEPGGETLTIRSNLLAPSGVGRDNALARAATTLTINDPPAPTPPTSLALSASPATVTESATDTDVTITATFVGGTFAEARRGFFQATGGTATVGDDYTSVSRTNFTIPANAVSFDVVVPFRANVDTIVESGGETVIFTGALLVADIDSGANDPLPVTSATITIIDAAAQPVIVVNAGADQTVAPGDTITLAGAVTTSSGPAADVALAWSLVGTTGDLSNALRSGGAGTTAASTAASAIRNDILAITNARNGSFAAPPVSLGLTSPVMFTVRLTGTATGQQDGTDDVVITVEPPVTGEFAVSLSGPSTVAPGATVTVTATVTGAIAADEDLAVTWTISNLFDFFDGTLSNTELGRISGQFSAATGVTLTFTAPSADEVGEAAIDLDIHASVDDPDGGNVNPVPVTGDFTITVMAGGAVDTEPEFPAGTSIAHRDLHRGHTG